MMHSPGMHAHWPLRALALRAGAALRGAAAHRARLGTEGAGSARRSTRRCSPCTSAQSVELWQNLPTPSSLPGLPATPQQLVGVRVQIGRAGARRDRAAAVRRCEVGPRAAGPRPGRAAACGRRRRRSPAGGARARRGMRESYDKCLTPPITPFYGTEQMPRTFLALNFSVAVTRKIAEEVERHKAAMADAGFRVAWVPAAEPAPDPEVPRLDRRGAGRGRRRRLPARRGPPSRRSRPGRSGSARSRRCRSRTCCGSASRRRRRWRRCSATSKRRWSSSASTRRSAPYHPHVTVGRVKEARGSAADLWKSDALVGSSAFTEIVVYESRTRSAGAEYVARARVPLGDKEKR